MLRDLIDSGGLRVAGYGIVAVAALVAGIIERTEVSRRRAARWPLFCFAGAALLAVMGLSRAAGLADAVEGFGRTQAYLGGWYEARGPVQILAVGIVSSIWLVIVGLAIWRTPNRRARYLPAALGLISLIGFAAVRVVSFHYVDAVLYNRGLAGLRFVTIFELTGLIATGVAFFWHPFEDAKVPVKVSS